MQITIDTGVDTAAEFRLVADFLQRLAAHEEAVRYEFDRDLAAAPAVIDEADRPDVGAPEPEPVRVQVTAPAQIMDTPTAAEAFGASVPLPPPLPTDAASEPTAADAGARDVKGLPWDERIHSSNRKTNADGTWAKRRNVDPQQVLAVEAQLRAALVAVPPAAPIVVPPVPPAYITPEAATVHVPLPPTAPTAAVPGAAPSPTDFGGLMARVTPHMIPGGKVNPELLQAACAAAGLTSLGDLPANKTKTPAVWDALIAMTGPL